MLIRYFWNNWRYSNAPEGQQPFEKVVGLSKYGFITGLGIGTYDSVMISQTTGFWSTVNCISYWVVPLTAMCATFASVAYTTTKIRGKDDYFNYIVASLATGGVFYRWQRKGPLTYSWTIAIIACATIKKFSDLTGFQPLPLHPEIREEYTTFPWDMTIIKDPRGPRSWE
ncbi:PREDICTED: uncharacterized protein LOC108751651 [Trachymyrmex septentrionalis]|nr:PREDICTED: uncharacterized protein LOC108751651 [Trachymyrmex septentrionalis]XP_018347440.1 PREDICTED: uncharacterized protein LOC108751651 [Trachymyrmex septentrionalis]XP_018347441.1 PREDICTED: uncharacterized protein LOC108751651 [Trachymyrmex septentrionalis]XP_018347442.1 PREDICTED: uncharacterized protein LOC108751651 [Trachymyrmex septentrionalis]XP_018347443.1 PREDICTED: uncharacterized protein LOC108751651 [Trachymyrmex septentrionalis]